MTDIRCSFCGLTRHEVSAHQGKMIAGPANVYICAACVQLCAEVLVEQQANGSLTSIGEDVELIARLTSERDAAVSRARELELGMQEIARSAMRSMPELRALRCMWCELTLADDAAAREHVATCERHPAVVELRSRDARRRARKR